MSQARSAGSVVACHVCGQYKPVDECTQISVELNVGRTSGAIGLGLTQIAAKRQSSGIGRFFGSSSTGRQRSGSSSHQGNSVLSGMLTSLRWMGGRKHYRQMKVDVCAECREKQRKSEIFRNVFFLLVLGACIAALA